MGVSRRVRQLSTAGGSLPFAAPALARAQLVALTLIGSAPPSLLGLVEKLLRRGG